MIILDLQPTPCIVHWYSRISKVKFPKCHHTSCSFMHIIDYDIISSCLLNSILGWLSFMHIIIIYMSEWVYMYILPEHYSNCSSNWSIHWCSFMHIIIIFTWVSECTCISTKAVVNLLWNWYIHACHYYLYDIYNSGVENNYVTLNLLQTIIDSEIVKQNFGVFGPKMGVKMRISKNPFHPSEMTP